MDDPCVLLIQVNIYACPISIQETSRPSPGSHDKVVVLYNVACLTGLMDLVSVLFDNDGCAFKG